MNNKLVFNTWADEMNPLNKSLRDKKTKTIAKVIGIVLVMSLLALLFSFQQGKSDDNSVVEKETEWQTLLIEKETIHLHWLRTLNPKVKKTDGDLLWNTELQKGLMRFVHLPKLKSKQYYQLWIYDLHQSTEKPVSGGVFSVGHSKGDTFYASIIPEHKIVQPFKFLLTIGNKGDKTFTKSQSVFLAQP